jgi:hypothetical protein
MGPVVGDTVQIVFSPAADTTVCWCLGQDHPVIKEVTNAAGDATFYISAGGCLDPSQDPNLYADVYAGTPPVFLKTVGAVSPDALDDNGLYPWIPWSPGGWCRTGLGDWVIHTDAIQPGIYAFCSDMDSDLVMTLYDAVLLTLPIALGEICQQGP